MCTICASGAETCLTGRATQSAQLTQPHPQRRQRQFSECGIRTLSHILLFVPSAETKRALISSQDSSEYICLISQRHAMLCFFLFFLSPACRLKPWWRWLGNSLRKLWINSMFCPWPLAPPSSVAFFDGLHMFTFHFRSLFPFYRVCGVGGAGGRRRGWGRGPSEDAPGVQKTTNKARTRGVACLAMCLRCAFQENINTCDSSPEILLPLFCFVFVPLTFLTA